MTLEFKKLTNYKEGLIYSILIRSYEELLKQKPNLENKWKQDWRQYDKDIFQFPETIGSSVFITVYKEIVIGFGSYDLRQRPDLGIIGHNCVLPEYRGKSS